MIVHLVDQSGYRAYSGHDGNPKVAELVAQGFVQVSVPPPESADRQRWTGASWIADPVATAAPENAPLTPEDIERLLLVAGITQAQIVAVKRDRGGSTG